MAILTTKMDTAQATIKDLSNKFDAKPDQLMYFIVGGVIVEAGFGLYLKERNWKRMQPKVMLASLDDTAPTSEQHPIPSGNQGHAK